MGVNFRRPVSLTTSQLRTRPHAQRSHLLIPPLPYVIGSGLLLLLSGVALMFTALPQDASADLRVADALVAVLLAVGAAALWFFGPRTTNDWALDAVTLIVAAMVAGSLHMAPTAASEVVIGCFLILFAVFAAYFRPLPVFFIELAALAIAYGVGALTNPEPLGWGNYLAVILVMVASSAMVAVLGERLREQALHDSLTGCLNRRGLDLMAHHISSTSRRHGPALTVGLIDLDDFKAFNDEAGHLAGDQRLIDISDAWRSRLRASDIMARYGGDEFAIVLPGATPDAASHLADQIHELSAGPWSSGFATWDPNEDLYAALARADRELYRAKAIRKSNSV